MINKKVVISILNTLFDGLDMEVEYSELKAFVKHEIRKVEEGFFDDKNQIPYTTRDERVAEQNLKNKEAISQNEPLFKETSHELIGIFQNEIKRLGVKDMHANYYRMLKNQIDYIEKGRCDNCPIIETIKESKSE